MLEHYNGTVTSLEHHFQHHSRHSSPREITSPARHASYRRTRSTSVLALGHTARNFGAQSCCHFAPHHNSLNALCNARNSRNSQLSPLVCPSMRVSKYCHQALLKSLPQWLSQLRHVSRRLRPTRTLSRRSAHCQNGATTSHIQHWHKARRSTNLSYEG